MKTNDIIRWRALYGVNGEFAIYVLSQLCTEQKCKKVFFSVSIYTRALSKPIFKASVSIVSKSISYQIMFSVLCLIVSSFLNTMWHQSTKKKEKVFYKCAKEIKLQFMFTFEKMHILSEKKTNLVCTEQGKKCRKKRINLSDLKFCIFCQCHEIT